MYGRRTAFLFDGDRLMTYFFRNPTAWWDEGRVVRRVPIEFIVGAMVLAGDSTFLFIARLRKTVGLGCLHNGGWDDASSRRAHPEISGQPPRLRNSFIIRPRRGRLQRPPVCKQKTSRTLINLREKENLHASARYPDGRTLHQAYRTHNGHAILTETLVKFPRLAKRRRSQNQGRGFNLLERRPRNRENN